MNESKLREKHAEEFAADGERFLSRWSRLKRQSESENAPPREAESLPAAAQKPPNDSDMPPVESLDENADIGGFLSPRVSKHLQKRALRKVFLSGKFNIRDGLDDYDDDFTSFAPLGDVITAEMRRMQERMRERTKDSLESQEEKTGADSAAPETVPEKESDVKTGESDSRPDARADIQSQ